MVTCGEMMVPFGKMIGPSASTDVTQFASTGRRPYHFLIEDQNYRLHRRCTIISPKVTITSPQVTTASPLAIPNRQKTDPAIFQN